MTDVTSSDVRCYDSAESDTSSTLSVTAGSTIGFTVSGNPANLYHPGVRTFIFDLASPRLSLRTDIYFHSLRTQVVNVYMAQAPSGTDVADFDGSGDVWFKVRSTHSVIYIYTSAEKTPCDCRILGLRNLCCY